MSIVFVCLKCAEGSMFEGFGASQVRWVSSCPDCDPTFNEEVK